MSKRNNGFSKERLGRYLKEGRGQGEGKNYKPWLTIQDFPSKGRASRVFGSKTQRIHQLFTDSETRYFYLLEWEDNVIDIREHYPLLDFDEVVKEKDDLNFDYFKDKNSGEYYVLSTSFLITVKDMEGEVKYIARSLKASSELEKKITIERLEIERRYWESKGIDWGIITEKDIPVIKAKNIEWIHSSIDEIINNGVAEENLILLIDDYLNMLQKSSVPIRVFNKEFEDQLNLSAGTGLSIFKYLLANKKIYLDMSKEININDLTSDVKIVIGKEDKEGKVICF
ncbi:MAG: TnsA endonuclease C-terminal domain-containing protein [Clostridium sp.]